jgi:hypothetical protein
MSKKFELEPTRSELLVEKHTEILESEKFPKLESPTKKAFIAMLLENWEQYRLNEKTETGDVEKYDPVLLSVIRRGYPNLIGMEIFGTQPMSGPTGLIFGMRSVFHNSTANPVKYVASVVLLLADASSFAVGDTISNAAGAVGTVRYVEGNTVLVQITSTITSPYTCLTVFTVGECVDDADPYAAAVTTIAAIYPNEIAYKFLWKDYAKFTTVALAEAATTNIKEVGFDIFKEQVTAENFKLKTKYSDELQQDLKAQQNLDADTELTRIMSAEITAELNKKFIDKWNEKAALGGTTSWTYATSGTPGRWEMERTYEMYGNINKVANQIAKTTLRGRGNILICSLDVISKLETMRHWIAAPSVSAGLTDVNLGASAFMGTLGNKYKVYADMYAASDYVSIGYKGGEWDTGIFYCPYVPVYVKKGIGEEDGQNRIWFHTRYGIGYNPFGAELYYRLINVTL